MAPARARTHGRVGAAARLAVALVAGAALASACSGDPALAPLGPDAGEDDASVDFASCPAESPEDGAPCSLPEGTTCDFGRCGTRLARCLTGIWRFAGNPPPAPICPDPAPDPDTACPPCWDPSVSCRYGTAQCQADAGPNRTVATCPNGSWEIVIEACQDGGGADVQGDALAEED